MEEVVDDLVYFVREAAEVSEWVQKGMREGRRKGRKEGLYYPALCLWRRIVLTLFLLSLSHPPRPRL